MKKCIFELVFIDTEDDPFGRDISDIESKRKAVFFPASVPLLFKEEFALAARWDKQELEAWADIE